MLDITQQIQQHEIMETKLTEQKIKFEQLALMQEEELDKLKERYDSLCEELELVYLQKDELTNELASMKSKLEVSKTVQALKLDQFQVLFFVSKQKWIVFLTFCEEVDVSDVVVVVVVVVIIYYIYIFHIK